MKGSENVLITAARQAATKELHGFCRPCRRQLRQGRRELLAGLGYPLLCAQSSLSKRDSKLSLWLPYLDIRKSRKTTKRRQHM